MHNSVAASAYWINTYVHACYDFFWELVINSMLRGLSDLSISVSIKSFNLNRPKVGNILMFSNFKSSKLSAILKISLLFMKVSTFTFNLLSFWKFLDDQQKNNDDRETVFMLRWRFSSLLIKDFHPFLIYLKKVLRQTTFFHLFPLFLIPVNHSS